MQGLSRLEDMTLNWWLVRNVQIGSAASASASPMKPHQRRIPEDACPVEHMAGDWSIGISFVVFDAGQVRFVTACARQVEVEYGLDHISPVRERLRA